MTGTNEMSKNNSDEEIVDNEVGSTEASEFCHSVHSPAARGWSPPSPLFLQVKEAGVVGWVVKFEEAILPDLLKPR